MRIYNFPQYSDLWRAIKKKKMGASHAQAIGNCGKGLKTYIEKIMQEYYSNAERDDFSSRHTERGIDLEDSAGTVYSFDRNITIKKVGFVVYNDYMGCSPDLFANKDGLCEIKCLDDKAHFPLVLGGKFESKYIYQCQCQMLICEKEWCDLVSYNPNFDKYLVVIRLTPDLEMFEKLRKGFKLGEKMIKEIERKMRFEK